MINKKWERWGRMKQENSWFSRSKKYSDEANNLKKDVSEMQTWMRNLEQQVLSVGARLGAVENRLTYSLNSLPNETKDEKNLMYSEQLITNYNEQSDKQVKNFEKQLLSVQQSFSKINHQLEKLEDFKKNSKKKVSQLDEKIRPQSFVMKIGKREIPLELTGIIGGFIAFIVAGLLVFNASSIVLNPWFLIGIGSLLIGSSFLRTTKGISILKKISDVLFSKSSESQIHHSDSTS